MHILNGMKRWTVYYLSDCRNQDKLIKRMEIINEKFQKRLQQMTYFDQGENASKDDVHSARDERINSNALIYDDSMCGYIFEGFGLTGRHMKIEFRNKNLQFFESLNTYYNFHANAFVRTLSSVSAKPGCWISLYSHVNFKGYSAVCDAVSSEEPVTCDINNEKGIGPLVNSQTYSLRKSFQILISTEIK